MRCLPGYFLALRCLIGRDFDVYLAILSVVRIVPGYFERGALFYGVSEHRDGIRRSIDL